MNIIALSEREREREREREAPTDQVITLFRLGQGTNNWKKILHHKVISVTYDYQATAAKAASAAGCITILISRHPSCFMPRIQNKPSFGKSGNRNDYFIFPKVYL